MGWTIVEVSITLNLFLRGLGAGEGIFVLNSYAGRYRNAVLLNHHRIRPANPDGCLFEVGFDGCIVVRVVRAVVGIVRDRSVRVVLALDALSVSFACVP